jgi:tRNA (adenine57-N1/adenine58-N1)-methyltransferase
MTAHLVSKNDRIVLIPVESTSGQRICFQIEGKNKKISGLGIFNPNDLINKPFGSKITLGRKSYWLLPANTNDQLETLTRKAQIILPKDSMQIAHYCDVKSGSKVVEGGLGSGALTIILLTLVAPHGKVTTYEIRPDFARIGAQNIEKTGLKTAWELKQQDITKGIKERDVDAVILDIPEPWLVTKLAWNALCAGGVFAGYVPTMNQVEKLVNALRKKPYIDIHTFETMQRELVVGTGGTRPSFDMLGHTGYITVARKVLSE